MNIERIFTYHAPSSVQVEDMNTLRALARNLAKGIEQLVPAGADQTAAIRKLRECIMTANAGIILNGQL